MPRQNDPCPCGSGKKYKKCCAREEAARPEHNVISFVPPPASDRSSGPAGEILDPEGFTEEEVLEEIEKAIDDGMLDLIEAMGDLSGEDEDRILENHAELIDLLEHGSESGEMITEDDANELVFALHPELLNWEDEDYERAKVDDEVDWRLHRTLDALVIRRATDPSLPDGDAIRRLKKKGITTAEAIHSVARVLADDIWHRLRLPTLGEKMAAAGESPLSLTTELEKLNKKTNQRISKLGLR